MIRIARQTQPGLRLGCPRLLEAFATSQPSQTHYERTRCRRKQAWHQNRWTLLTLYSCIWLRTCLGLIAILPSHLTRYHAEGQKMEFESLRYDSDSWRQVLAVKTSSCSKL